ncbi:MAG: dihydropteroate synthase [Deferrisomatales bacterium]
MILVAENLTVTYPEVARSLAERDPEPLHRVARLARAAGARYLDVNLGAGRRGGPDAVEYVLEVLDGVWEGGVLIDTLSAEAMDRAARCWPGPVVLNGYSGDPGRAPVLEVAAAHGLEVVVLLMAGGIPRSADERLALAAELAGRCGEYGIETHRLWFDPVVAPLGWTEGQEYDAALFEVLRRLPEVFGGPVRSIAGLSNLTTGAAGAPRVPWLQVGFLAAAAGAGLSHAMVDVGNAGLVRVARALEVFAGRRLYAPDELA